MREGFMAGLYKAASYGRSSSINGISAKIRL